MRNSRLAAVLLLVGVVSITFCTTFCSEPCSAQHTFASGYPDVRPQYRTAARGPILAGLTGAARSRAPRPQAETTNFVVFAPDEIFARKVAKEAERFRKELAIQWLGYELSTWNEKCPILVEIQPHAGGETSFAFMTQGGPQGIPTGWDMKIFGPPDRLLDAVLPHEITHTIFATHFQRPLPRWADEGACTTVEHVSEKRKNHSMLMNFLSAAPSRGLPFNRMFTMRNYPEDILPLYAQGFSVAKFLIMQKGRRHFLDYIQAGLNMETPGRETSAWDRATNSFYGYQDLSDLQLAWIAWVRDGSIEQPIPGNLPKLQDNLNDRMAATARPGGSPSQMFSDSPRQSPRGKRMSNNQSDVTSMNRGWYAKQMEVGSAVQNNSPSERIATNRERIPDMPKRKSADTIWR